MKSFMFSQVVAVALFSSTLLHAEPQFQNEFKQLRERRDKALVSAIDSVNRRFEPGFDGLMRKATKASDLDTAKRVKQVQSTIAAMPYAMVNTDAIIGKWDFRAGNWSDVREFKPDGWIISKMDGVGRWVVVGTNLRLDFPNGNWSIFPLPTSNKILVGKTQAGEKQTAEKIEEAK